MSNWISSRKIIFANFSNTWLFTWIIAIGFTISAFISISHFGSLEKPLNIVDEHMHFDYAVTVQHGELPFRGKEINDEVVNEWICGVGHASGAPISCEDLPNFNKDQLSVGKYSTAYAHFPTYYQTGVLFSEFLIKVNSSLSLLTTMRIFSSLLLSLSCGTGILFAKALKMGPLKQIIIGLIPISAASIFFYGTIVNPSSAVMLLATLTSGFGLLWISTGKGIAWFYFSAALGSMTLFLANLPTFVFVLYLVITLYKKIDRNNFSIRSVRKEIIQIGTLSAIALLPIMVWTLRISATATATNTELFGGNQFAVPSIPRVILNLAGETFRIHFPWLEDSNMLPADPENPFWPLRAEFSSLPIVISFLVLGTLIFHLVQQRRSSHQFTVDNQQGAISLAKQNILIVSTLIIFFLFAPIFRLSQILISNFDYPVVDRYALPMVPILVFLALAVATKKSHQLVLLIPTFISAVTLFLYGLSAT